MISYHSLPVKVREHLLRSVVAGGQGAVAPLASEIRKFSEIQKFLGNSLSVWLLAQTRCLSFHSFKLHSNIVETNHSIWDAYCNLRKHA